MNIKNANSFFDTIQFVFFNTRNIQNMWFFYNPLNFNNYIRCLNFSLEKKIFEQ